MTAGAEDQGSEETPPARVRFARSAPPDELPPELHEQVAAAARRARELASQGRELHFTPGGSGRIVVEVRNLDGTVVGVLSGAEALDVISGGELRL